MGAMRAGVQLVDSRSHRAALVLPALDGLAGSRARKLSTAVARVPGGKGDRQRGEDQCSHSNHLDLPNTGWGACRRRAAALEGKRKGRRIGGVTGGGSVSAIWGDTSAGGTCAKKPFRDLVGMLAPLGLLIRAHARRRRNSM